MTAAPIPRTRFQTQWFSVEEEVLSGPSGFEGQTFYRLNRPDGIIVLATTPRDEIVLVRQFRPALGTYTLELPCGTVDPGEAPAAAAAREFHEETGFACRSLEPLGVGRIMMSRVAAREFAYLGHDAERDPAFTPAEPIEVVLATRDEFRELALSGHFEQLASLGIVLLAHWKADWKF